MSLSKFKPFLLALLTATIFLPWRNRVDAVYGGIYSYNNQYGYQRVAGWVIIVFCIIFLVIDINIDKNSKTKLEVIRKYLTWSFMLIILFDMMMISFNSDNGFFIPQYGIILALFVSVSLHMITKSRK